MKVLIVSVSARMLAELAVADGYEVVAVDRFGDVDLRAIAPAVTAHSSEALAALAAGIDADAVVYGAGFENWPELIGQMAGRRELLGTPPELLRAVRDPWQVGEAARVAGARAPETRGAGEGGAPGGEWLRKPRRGGGGRGVRRWIRGPLDPSEIGQRRVHGLSCSAVAIGDGRGAVLLGITEQLHRAASFQWTGNVVPPRLPSGELAELAGQLRAVCAEVALRFGVRGAFGVDAIWDGHHAWVLEVNPRPPASLELFGPGCFEAHVRGARGIGLPHVAAATTGRAAVKLVVYADRAVRAPDPDWWPADLIRDVPHSGEDIKCGAPVCTLVAHDIDVDALADRAAHLLSALPGTVLVG